MAIAPLIKLIKKIPKIEHEDGSALLKFAYHADEKAIVQLAWFLEQGHWVERDLELVFELYRWLKQNVKPCYQAECIRIQHLLTPELPYKPSVVRKLFKWYKEGNALVAGALTMALLSNKSMLQDYNAILLDIIQTKPFHDTQRIPVHKSIEEISAIMAEILFASILRCCLLLMSFPFVKYAFWETFVYDC